MYEQASEIEKLIQEAIGDRDLSAFLDALLEPSRPISRLMTLRRDDLLFSDQKTGASLKWLVWADSAALDSDLKRIRDYRKRASYETETLLAEFVDVFGSVLENQDKRNAFLTAFFSAMNEQDSDDASEFEGVIEKMAEDAEWRRRFIESLFSYILSVVKSGMLTEFFVDISIARVKDLLGQTGMSLEEYTTALDSIFNFELVTSQSTLFWCDECSPIPRTLVATYTERPTRLQMNCPTCNRNMNTVSIIEPCEEVVNWINTKDGLLSVLVGYALDKEGLDWRASVVTEREMDFLVGMENVNIVIEVKMHRIYREKDTEALDSTLNKDVCQLAQTCDSLQKEEEREAYGALVWNQDVPSDVVARVLSGKPVSKRYDPRRLSVVSLSAIDEFVKNLGKPDFPS